MKRRLCTRVSSARRWVAGLIAATAFTTVAWAASPAEPLAPGTHVTFRDAAGREWCATVTSIEVGVDGMQTAWLKIDADPRRLARAPVSELVAGCQS